MSFRWLWEASFGSTARILWILQNPYDSTEIWCSRSVRWTLEKRPTDAQRTHANPSESLGFSKHLMLNGSLREPWEPWESSGIFTRSFAKQARGWHTRHSPEFEYHRARGLTDIPILQWLVHRMFLQWIPLLYTYCNDRVNACFAMNPIILHTLQRLDHRIFLQWILLPSWILLLYT